MNTPTPTPRTDAAWSATFDSEQMSAGRTARALREHSQQLETELVALTAERDKLRDQLAAARQRETVAIASWDEERGRALREGARVVELKARAELAEAALADAQPKSDHYMASWLERAAARAEKAERELATERARLDWLESPAGMDWQWQAGITRATIDAKMQKDAK